jgi:formylglycine-generating enzyme required for sulfatase activity
VALIAGAALIVLVVAAVLIWRAQKNRNPSSAGEQATTGQPSTETQTSTAPQPSAAKPSQTPGAGAQNPIGIELINVPPGSFMMGANDFTTSEKPVHQVTFKEGFYMGKYEVTQAQWQAVMGNNPSTFKKCGGNCPVENVSWNDAQIFLKKLNESDGSFKYRLPTEAEWEYACRAGTKGFYAGNLDAMAWYVKNSGSKTHPVGSRAPNAFGLYDMHGNVYEWCQDNHHETYDGAPSDGSAWSIGGEQNTRMARGGSWNDDPTSVSSFYRAWDSPDNREYILGLRVVAVARSR